MTTMSLLDAPFRTLFSRVDSIPRPHTERLMHLFDRWQQTKGSAIAPRLRAFADGKGLPADGEAFLFERAMADDHDFELRSGAHSLAPLLGDIADGAFLSGAPDRRGAVRCRRVFDWVLKTGEPVLVEFQARPAGHERISFEMLALPLTADDGTIHAVLGGLSARPVISGGWRPSRAHRDVPAPLLFAFKRDEHFAQALARRLDLRLSPLEEREFEDGEHKARPLVDVRNRETCVIASLNGGPDQSVNDRLCRLLFFIAALKTNGARTVTAVIPYLCYMRKDRQTKPHDPLTGRYVAQLMEAVGTDCLITMEAHNLAALQNAFRCPVVHLEPYDAFATFFAAELGGEAATVVSPDLGGSKRAEKFREVLENRLGYAVGKAFLEKQRSSGVVSGDLFAGDVKGRAAIIIDDMIVSGTTIGRAALACHERGATRIYVAAAHGLFSKQAPESLLKPYIDGICVTNSVKSEVGVPGLHVLDVTDTFASAINGVDSKLA